MANRRMFSLDIIDTDHFLELPIRAQCLYFHLGMRADDDGFVSSPNKILRMIGFAQTDLESLKDEGYVITFQSGVLVLSHWKHNNQIRADRYHETVYKKEKEELREESGVYKRVTNKKEVTTKCQPSDNQCVTEVSIDKVSTGKERKEKDSCSVSEEDNEDKEEDGFALPSFLEIENFEEEAEKTFRKCLEKVYQTIPPDKRVLKEHCEGMGFDGAEKFYDYYQSVGWMLGKRKMYDWRAALNNWVRKDNIELPNKEDGDSIIESEVRCFHNDVNHEREKYENKTLEEALMYWICERRYEEDSINSKDILFRILNMNWDLATRVIDDIDQLELDECETEEERDELFKKQSEWRDGFIDFIDSVHEVRKLMSKSQSA